MLHENSRTLNLKIYAFLATHRDFFHFAHVGATTIETVRAILIVMEPNLSGTFGQIIWLENQNSFSLF